MIIFRRKVSRASFVRLPAALSHDEFAPYNGLRVCLSSSGRWRPNHIPDKDGRCILCGKREVNAE